MLAGLSVALLWQYMNWHGSIYEGMIGIITGLFIFYICDC